MSRTFAAILCDIDGCLGPESSHPLDIAGLSRIAEHNRRAESDPSVGPLLTLCSGRPQPFAEALCRTLANTTMPVVAENGVWLFHPATSAFMLDPAISDDHLRMVAEATAYIRRDLVPRGVVIQPGKTASISLYHDDTPTLLGLRDELKARFTREGWRLRVSNTVRWINCDLEHVSKSTGIDRFMRVTGLTKPALAGIGDSLSDMAIRTHVAWFACPSNADERLKEHADYVSPDAEIAGVLDIVERLTRISLDG
ncbi:MAG: HAD hydrolase family protein [Phycisphaerales bacterium]|nr:MAG: HAD hydrolase family protein [Phycisphaerales bacterium]